jgi:ABC-type lipoprotein export system ATPase subunit
MIPMSRTWVTNVVVSHDQRLTDIASRIVTIEDGRLNDRELPAATG